ncbi:MAG: CPBP family intramembrane glutamic endopeptidase [Ferruginibacter sp.]
MVFMLVCIIYYNYYEHNLISFHSNDKLGGGLIRDYFIFLIPFSIAFIIQSFFLNQFGHFNKKWFWIILFVAPAIFTLKMNFNLRHLFIRNIWKDDQQLFWLRCSKWFAGLFMVIIPVYVLWKLKDSPREPFYGTRRLRNAKPYFLMILCMVPLIALAATQADFLRMYPRASVVGSWDLHPQYAYYLLHEFFYSLDFITIEIFFRGFLIISLINISGAHCIVPAACFYCCIHLGKPMGEAISSFAGGLFLGIISYNTKSIRGGLIVHLGIAWLMEIAGFIAHQF